MVRGESRRLCHGEEAFRSQSETRAETSKNSLPPPSNKSRSMKTLVRRRRKWKKSGSGSRLVWNEATHNTPKSLNQHRKNILSAMMPAPPKRAKIQRNFLSSCSLLAQYFPTTAKKLLLPPTTSQHILFPVSTSAGASPEIKIESMARKDGAAYAQF